MAHPVYKCEANILNWWEKSSNPEPVGISQPINQLLALVPLSRTQQGLCQTAFSSQGSAPLSFFFPFFGSAFTFRGGGTLLGLRARSIFFFAAAAAAAVKTRVFTARRSPFGFAALPTASFWTLLLSVCFVPLSVSFGCVSPFSLSRPLV